MLNETQTTEFLVTRDGKPDNSFKKKYKKIKVAIVFAGLITAVLVKKLAHATAHKLEEISRPVRLDIIDHTYGTNLRAQYFSGRRTQQILQAKRQHGLI